MTFPTIYIPLALFPFLFIKSSSFGHWQCQPVPELDAVGDMVRRGSVVPALTGLTV